MTAYTACIASPGKNRHFYVPRPSFLVCPGDAPVAITQNVAWMKRQFSACQTPRSMYLSIFKSFRVIRCLSQCVSLKIAIFTYHSPHFCFPWRRPCDYHTICCMMERQFSACQTPRSIYPSIFFPSYSSRNCKKIAIFTYRSPHFCFPGDAPAIIMQYVAWMKRQFSACQTPRSMCLSIFNSFRVIQCLSQCVSPKIAIFTQFWFLLGTPLGQWC